LITILGGFKEIEDLKAGPFNFGKIITFLLHFWSLALIPFRIIKANNRFTKNKKEAS
jgi:large-conductance mechanosensitive channel